MSGEKETELIECLKEARFIIENYHLTSKDWASNYESNWRKRAAKLINEHE